MGLSGVAALTERTGTTLTSLGTTATPSVAESAAVPGAAADVAPSSRADGAAAGTCGVVSPAGGAGTRADRRGRWQPEYICRACALVYPDCMEYDWSGVGDWWWLAARRSLDTAGDEAPRQDSTHKGRT
jgi:hypothetical protein